MKQPKGVSKKNDNKERFFSIELGSKDSLKGISMSNGGPENVLVEGTIGTLQRAVFAEGIVLEVVGSKGVLRINIGENEIGKLKEESDD
jgi:hypothetical protein